MTNPIIDKFKAAYRDMKSMDLGSLDQIYSDDVIFKDPVHEIRGLVELQDYMAEMCSNIEECRFEFLDVLSSDAAAYIKWNMHFRHPKLADGKLLTVKGISHIEFNGRISFHEDCYDLGAMAYEWIPVLGGVTRMIKKRMAS